MADTTRYESWHADWDDVATAFRKAVAPTREPTGRPDRRRKADEVLPPVVFLSERPVQEATRRLDLCVPRIDGGDPPAVTIRPRDTDPVEGVSPVLCAVGAAELATRAPRRTGRLRLPALTLVQAVVDQVRRPPSADASPSPQPTARPADALRDHCYDVLRPARRGLAVLGGEAQAPGAVAQAWNRLAGPLFQQLPRWLWARGQTRRLMRSRRTGWYAKLRNDGSPLHAGEFFEDIHSWVTRLVEGDGRPADHRERTLERLLLHALLSDLRRWARPGRLSPWRRRRVTRFVLFLRVEADADTEAAKRAARFVEEYAGAVSATGCGAVLLAVDGPSGLAVEGAVSRTLAEAAVRLRRPAEAGGGLRPLLVTLPGDLPSSDPPQARPPVMSRVGPGVEATAWGAVAAVAAASTLWFVGVPLPDAPACLGSSGPVDAPGPEGELPPPDAAYADVERDIEEQNAAAEALHREGREVRTIAYVGTGATRSQAEMVRRSDGAVPELRGVALAQRHLNQEAEGDPDKVLLRIEIYDGAGERYADAVDVAETIVRDARAASEDEGADTAWADVVGVVGFAQSRDETRAAVYALAEAKLPVVTTSATADEMNPGTFFHAMAPPNSREAAVVSAFARRANIVEEAPGECVPARAAVVVKDPSDLYSDSIGRHFAASFREHGGAVEQVHQFRGGEPPSNPGSQGVTVADTAAEVSDAICAAVTREPRTIVYWAARAAEFQNFLNHYGDSSECSEEPLTVVGGNELTNAVLSEPYASRRWLRLYHTTHVLPVGHEALSEAADTFNRTYAEHYDRNDVWRHDGHAALAYDAVHVLSDAANDVYTTAGEDLDAIDLQDNIELVQRQGASGYLDFQGDAPVPLDKPVVILHHVASGSWPVLYCGTFTRVEPVDTWGPDGAHDCP
ncbi:hypothetical protein ACTWP5_09400 [Streptomyces sp. 4N509B]|uniref:hypothetical protein n=1 Tax=Streptomyces sp. 4N509B TaxID=3457413 RepID=UPI003FD421A8